jgi:hypothetical protein
MQTQLDILYKVAMPFLMSEYIKLYYACLLIIVC